MCRHRSILVFKAHAKRFVGKYLLHFFRLRDLSGIALCQPVQNGGLKHRWNPAAEAAGPSAGAGRASSAELITKADAGFLLASAFVGFNRGFCCTVILGPLCRRHDTSVRFLPPACESTGLQGGLALGR